MPMIYWHCDLTFPIYHNDLIVPYCLIDSFKEDQKTYLHFCFNYTTSEMAQFRNNCGGGVGDCINEKLHSFINWIWDLFCCFFMSDKQITICFLKNPVIFHITNILKWNIQKPWHIIYLSFSLRLRIFDDYYYISTLKHTSKKTALCNEIPFTRILTCLNDRILCWF